MGVASFYFWVAGLLVLPLIGYFVREWRYLLLVTAFFAIPCLFAWWYVVFSLPFYKKIKYIHHCTYIEVYYTLTLKLAYGTGQARSLDVKVGGVKLFLEGQLSTQTENVNTNTKKRYNGITLYKSMSKWSAK